MYEEYRKRVGMAVRYLWIYGLGEKQREGHAGVG